MKSREIEHTADLGIEVEGDHPAALFAEAGEALYGLIADRSCVSVEEEIPVSVQGEGWEELFHAWLCELLAQFNLNGFVGKECKVEKIGPQRIEGWIRGERLDLQRHCFYTEIKGVTYHNFKVWQEDHRWHARVIFDV